MSNNSFKEIKPGVEVAQSYPLEDGEPFFCDIVRIAPGASTGLHEQRGSYCYRLTAITAVSGFSMTESDSGKLEFNEHVYLQPGEYLTRDRGFRHDFINNFCDEIIMQKSSVPTSDCPRKKDGADAPCICRCGG